MRKQRREIPRRELERMKAKAQEEEFEIGDDSDNRSEQSKAERDDSVQSWAQAMI